MDIVSRLKNFINYKQIAITAFADECGIARPSFSQLLNGRNKKISHELIQKIHEAYPELSVMWLMFGEGSMIAGEAPTPAQHSTMHTHESSGSDDDDENPNTPAADNTITFDFGSPDDDDLSESYTDSDSTTDNDSEAAADSFQSPHKHTITFSADNTKKIMNIIVYYNDNSFETFAPMDR